jgi:protein gp37
VRFLSIEPLIGAVGPVDLMGIDWVIAGGESGPGARPIHLEWAREIRDQCIEQKVPFFFKQWGGIRPKSGGRELDGREWSEFPAQKTGAL